MDKLTSKHFIFIILGVCIVSLKTYPTIITKVCGKDSWIIIIISSLLYIAYFLIIINLYIKLKFQNISKIYYVSFGNLFGKIFLILFILTLFFTLIECCSIEASSMHTNMLLETPQYFFMLFFVIPGIYVSSKNLSSVIILTITGISFIFFAGINLFIFTQKYKKLKYLLPVLEHGITLSFLDGTLKSLGLLSCASILIPYFQFIKNKDKMLKDGLIGTLIVSQMQIVAMIGTISTFVIERLNNMYYPKLLQTQLVDYWGFLEVGELFVMIQIVGGWFIKYILTFYSLLLILKELKISNRYTIYAISLLVFTFSYIISKKSLVFFKYLNIYSYICFINFIIIPLLAFSISYFKSNKKSSVNK